MGFLPILSWLAAGVPAQNAIKHLLRICDGITSSVKFSICVMNAALSFLQNLLILTNHNFFSERSCSYVSVCHCTHFTWCCCFHPVLTGNLLKSYHHSLVRAFISSWLSQSFLDLATICNHAPQKRMTVVIKPGTKPVFLKESLL